MIRIYGLLSNSHIMPAPELAEVFTLYEEDGLLNSAGFINLFLEYCGVYGNYIYDDSSVGGYGYVVFTNPRGLLFI